MVEFAWSFLPGRIGMQHIYMIIFMFPGAKYFFSDETLIKRAGENEPETQIWQIISKTAF